MPRLYIYNFLFAITMLLLSNAVYTQNTIEGSIEWLEPLKYGLEGKEQYTTLNFEDAQFNLPATKTPFLYQSLNVGKNTRISSAEIIDATYQSLNENEKGLLEEEFKSVPDIHIEYSTIRKYNQSFIRIKPFRKNASGEIEKLMTYKLLLKYSKVPQNQLKNLRYATTSMLESGDWFKIAVTKDAVFKLDASFLNQLGVDVTSIDPRDIRMFGYGGMMLPQDNDEPRPDDLEEIAISVIGEGDARFDPQDYIIFYGEDQVSWTYDTAKSFYRHQTNLFSDTTYYFLTTNKGRGKRIQKETRPSGTASITITEYDHADYHEVDLRNLLGSGRLWLGEVFDAQLSYSFKYKVPNINVNNKGKVELSVLARSSNASTFDLQVNGQQFSTSISGTNLDRGEINFARQSNVIFSYDPSSGLQDFLISYNKPKATSKGWLNRLVFNVRRGLVHFNDQMFIRDFESAGSGQLANFELQSTLPIRVWNITDHNNVVEKDLAVNANVYSFINSTNKLHEFVSFDKFDVNNVHPIGKVANQNLHASSAIDLAIITHPLFKEQAIKLADFHRAEGLRVLVTTPQKIYNEFSSGSQDIVAIRSLFKMFYDRATTPADAIKYAVFYGDASYDYKNRINGNTNFVPAYQSPNSLDPVFSYVSDDYYGMLDDSEGKWATNSQVIDKLDMAIGRLPVKSVEEANGVLQKILQYSAPQSFGDWRNKVVFVADDEDGVTHMFQANELARRIETNNKEFNIKKIYLDAYQQQSTAGGTRYPDVNREINLSVEQGALFVNFTGHGGETGWTGERVLGISDVTSWRNINNLPIFITATCEFGKFDDPLRTSGGELTLLNPNGGGIALMTTTRLVFSSPNYLLNRVFYNRVFVRNSEGKPKRIGDIFMEVKNLRSSDANARNFSLLGDPALDLSIPEYFVKTISINGNPIDQVDTIGALSKINIKGIITDRNGIQLTNFNGTVTPTVFDKEEEKRTLNNDGGGVFNYVERDSRLFKGEVSVTNGAFSFDFVVPKDIAYSFGNGKISYYGLSQTNEDAHGYTEDFIIGGSSNNAINDNNGPDIELFMNDESFVFGGITDPNPILIVNLSDDQGINTVGNSIGHDIVAVLDGRTEDSFILNEFYEASLDDFTKGKINYPFNELPPGKHTLTLKAWDVANNSSERAIEFNVVEDQDIIIDNVVNYPNPFTSNTEFVFQHNQAGIPLDVKIEVFTVSGKLVKSIDKVVVNQGFLSRDIRWDGRDRYGDKIGKGIYVYKVQVRSRNGSSAEKYEKLVIL